MNLKFYLNGSAADVELVSTKKSSWNESFIAKVKVMIKVSLIAF
jgi:hypothetical protein